MIHRRLLAYGLAIASTGAALLASLWFRDFMTHTRGSFFYIAIAITAWYGGFRPGIVATVLSMLAVNYYFIPPLYQFQIGTFDEVLRLCLFTTVALILTLTIANLQASQRKVEKLSEQLLDESANRLKTVLEAAQMGMWHWSMETGKITWSPEHEHLFGLPLGSFDGTYAAFDACLHPDDRPGLTQAVDHAVKHRLPYHHEFRVVWADGSTHWIEGRGHASYNSAGEPVQMVGTVMAIDERKQLESELKQSEQQFRTIFEIEPECIKILTADGLLKTINPAGLAIIEADSLEVVKGQYVCEAIESPHRADFSALIRRAAQGESSFLEFEITGFKGTHRWLEARAVPLPVPNQHDPLVLCVTRDISDRKQLELTLLQAKLDLEQRVADRTTELTAVNDRLLEALQKQQHAQTVLAEKAREVEDLYNNAPCGYHSLDAEGRVVQINDTELRWLDLPREQILGQPFINFISPEHHPKLRENFLKFKQQGWIRDLEFEILAKGGTRRWFSVNATALKDEAGNLIRSRSTLFDITEAKEREAERQKIEDLKDEFIGVISHELRTPLTSIQMSLGLLHTGIYAHKPEKSQRMIEIALLETNRLVNLVNDILDLERLGSGKAVLEQTLCHAEELMQQAVNGVQAIADQHKITLAIAPSPFNVCAASDSIVQTLTNLLSNAIKFSPAHSVIHLSAEPQGDRLLFHVRDQGRGIPADMLETIFDRFQQVDASDSREKGGTGLGLSICRSIIERQGGKIWAESTIGAGSTFFFTLPYAPDHDLQNSCCR
jgi:PAS domain S-box-containing protein